MNEWLNDAGPTGAAKRFPAPVGMTGRCKAGPKTLWPVKLSIALLSGALFALSAVSSGQPLYGPKGQGAEHALGNAKQSFARHCATCHGLDGRGGEHAPAIVNTPAAAAHTDDALAGIIRHGIPDKGMPSFHFLTNQQIEQIICYIRVLRGSSGDRKNLKGDPAAGVKLFFGEARCSGCHMVQGKGGFIAPDLTEFGRSHSAHVIRQIILEPNKDLLPRWDLVNVVTHSGQHFSGMVRNEDNFSIALLSEDGTFHLLMKSDVARITREQRSIMPDDYGSKLSSQQLDDLASFLILGSPHQSSLKENSRLSNQK